MFFFLDKIGKVTFKDEIEAVREEVTKLNDSGVNKIIALGHAGIEMDLMIGRQVEGVDVVVGGHSNTFFYTGQYHVLYKIRGYFKICGCDGKGGGVE